MSGQPPGQEEQTTFHVDFARLTAGPAPPQATSVSLSGLPAQGAKAAKKKAPASRSNQSPTVTAATSTPSGALTFPSTSGPVSDPIQQMNIIHDAFSGSGFVVIAQPETMEDPAARPLSATREPLPVSVGPLPATVGPLPAAVEPLPSTVEPLPSTVGSLPAAPDMDVAAYQEAPPEVQVETLEMDIQEGPVAGSGSEQQVPVLVGPFTAKDLISMVPPRSSGEVLPAVETAAPGPVPPHPVGITRIISQIPKVIPVTTNVQPAPPNEWRPTVTRPVVTVQNNDTELVTSSVPSTCSACGVDKTGGVTSNFMDTNMEYAEMYQCDVCGQRKLTLKSEVSQPVTRSKEVPLEMHECSICWRDFKDAESLKVHQSVTHQAPSSFQCNFCTGVFSYQYECDMHEQFTHDKRAKLKCKLCSKEFVSKKRLKKHAAKCWNESGRGDLPASKVGGTQEKSEETEVGKWYNIPVDSKDKKTRTCKKCGRKFKSLRNYARHMQNFCTKNSYKCEGCDEVFATKRKLWAHEKEVKGQLHYTCTCGNQFRLKRVFKTHKQIHEGLRPYKCKYCDKGFIALNKCLIHERSHTGVKPYACQFCGQEYRLQESLRVHERKHLHDYRFICKYCNKGFVKKYTHQTHERNHEGIKPFPCSYCEKAFSRKADCARHELCMHSQGQEAYRFLCSHCGRAFKLKGDLKVHERIHTGEKPHYCDICNRGFGRTSYYNRHMKLYHGKADESMKSAAETLMTVATIGIEQSAPV